MTETANLSLPLIAAAQAQKHVTINEALSVLDGLVQLRILSRSLSAAPVATDGDTYLVGNGASGEWLGQDGQVAIYSNGGWVLLAPKSGWRAFVVDEFQTALFDGVEWVDGAASISPGRAATIFENVEISHSIGSGSTSATSALIPGNTLVFGVTGRVVSDITGTATSFELGVSGSSNRYGSGLGLSAGSYVSGLTGSPVAYYADTPLELTATGGAFDGGGTIKLVAHLFRMQPPA